MSFDSSLIVQPTLCHNGMTYGQWAAIWSNWLFSNQNQVGSTFFFRGNVNNEDKISAINENHITIKRDAAIFFPIICTISSEEMAPYPSNEMLRRKDCTDPEQNPVSLYFKINDTEIQELTRYYAESPEFVLEISTDSNLRHLFKPPLKPGKSRAVSAGYWIMLKPLPGRKYILEFEGVHRDGFRSAGLYHFSVQ